MILEILTYAGLSFTTVSLIIALVNMLLGPFLSKRGFSAADQKKVSILIPARNEEDNIGRCLASLGRQTYPNKEIIVLDDGSADKTAAEIQKFKNITMLTGSPLPEGWLGKNWACKQLADQARGDILIFTDADTWHEPEAVSGTIAWMETHRLDMISAFPQQIMRSVPEKLTIPFIDLILFTFLPLWLTLVARSDKFAAANGQWIAFRKPAYFQIGGHQAVKNKVVEDVELARLIKQAGYRMLTTSGQKMIYCRMYKNFSEIREGLEKNLYALTGHQPLLFLILLILLLTAYILPLALVFVPGLFFGAGLNLLMQISLRFMLAFRLKQNIILSTLLAPVTVLIGMFIGISSFYKTKSGRLRWKGRTIKIEQ